MKTKQTSIQNKQVKNSSELQSRSEQLSSDKASGEKLPRLDYDLRRQNRTLPTDKVLSLLQEEAPRFFELAEVVGNWVWIQFGQKQPRTVTAVLSQLGFHWNNKRQAWQHPCGQPTKTPASYDPRERYGSKFPADMRAA
ncbi:MAG: hypothetical protein H0X66_10330 [Verrucomicrobia bacterium]|nr:hypothetical protein [Verrucomicrobiota bacterium]